MEPLPNSNEIDIFPDQVVVKPISETISPTENIAESTKSPNYKYHSSGWRLNSNGVLEARSADLSNASGSFTTVDGKTITVVSGVITSIV